MSLKQARAGQKMLVDNDPQWFSWDETTDESNPWASTVQRKFKGRLSHKSSSVPSASESTAGIDYDLKHFLTTTYDVALPAEESTIEDESGVKWKVGRADPLRRFGGVYGYQINVIRVV